MKTVLVDGDLIAYRTAATVGNEEYLVYKRINKYILSIQAALETENINIYLSGKDKPNFRTLINPHYKANRKELEKPFWLDLCNLYLYEAWDAEYIHGYEADDALGWNQTDDTIICTIDKDLDMIPGDHYNFVKDIKYSVSPHEAIQYFYKQMLIGDATDNIFGVNKIGPVKAAKLIDILEEEQEMFDIVYNKYNDPKRFAMNADCLWIQQEQGITWTKRSQHLILPDQLQQEVAVMSDSMTSSPEGT